MDQACSPWEGNQGSDFLFKLPHVKILEGRVSQEPWKLNRLVYQKQEYLHRDDIV